ncbi:hypothetical protein [Micromonospora haikouensis]|uniref:hypothetical protein n=1 Tax=Micromonospora haikouensis TaxID=686309 RepID=UPI003D75E878
MTRTVAVITDLVEYDQARAEEWFANGAADSLDINERWPWGGDDDRLAAVRELIDRALDEDIILLLGIVEDVEVIETRDEFGILSGARTFVSTSVGVTVASGGPLWTDSFTDGETGRTGALTALAEAARMIDDLAGCFRETVRPERRRAEAEPTGGLPRTMSS